MALFRSHIDARMKNHETTVGRERDFFEAKRTEGLSQSKALKATLDYINTIQSGTAKYAYREGDHKRHVTKETLRKHLDGNLGLGHERLRSLLDDVSPSRKIGIRTYRDELLEGLVKALYISGSVEQKVAMSEQPSLKSLVEDPDAPLIS